MGTKEIIREIKKLPMADKISVIEKTLQSVKEDSILHPMEHASEVLYNDYKNDNELTAFTPIDFDNFYEAKWQLKKNQFAISQVLSISNIVQK